MPIWRLLSTDPLDGATNMALDLALMQRARETGESVFRTYGWSAPTLSFGRNQAANGWYDMERIAELGADIVRRPTGGRAILHWREVAYSVTAPAPAAGSSLSESYDRINHVLLDALRRMGVDATIATTELPARHPDRHPCFAEPSAGEIVLASHGGAGGRKLVASAQYREDGAMLQHGSILLEDDQPLLAELTIGDGMGPLAATLNGALGRTISPAEAVASLFAAVADVLDPGATQLSAEAAVPMAAPYVRLFRDPVWTWRR